MHCNFLVVSSIMLFGKGDIFQYDLIKPLKGDTTHQYLRFEGLVETPFELPRSLTRERLSNVSQNHIIYKICAEIEADLSSLEESLREHTYRKSDEAIDPTEMDPSYIGCSKQLDKLTVGITQIFMSAIRKNKLPPCTAKMLIKDISYRRARAYGPYGSYSHQDRAKIAIIWDDFIPFQELFDELDPLMTMKKQDDIIHLVYIAGFLKLIVRPYLEEGYLILPALGNLFHNDIYKFLENSGRHTIVPPHRIYHRG
ncbi:BgTH12-05154 [Blumeria graminis f. sp. triticale]|uniref:BgTH12-05154 n=1 Tax=Blumeria graminis f. sp. triticale TaxID=1689686 RepID=A0A9W4D1F6_BLUGR|nr:BgTH12-05154 [Blumeria graminis f. sp. triticale]